MDFLPNTRGLHLDMREEFPFFDGNAISTPFQTPHDVFKTNFKPAPVEPIRNLPPDYKEVARVIKTTTLADVHMKGSLMYEKRRKLKNGMCNYIHPDLVVVPKSTEDVSKIVKTASHYHVPLSVRSGGHSYTCQSIKPGNLHKLRRNNELYKKTIILFKLISFFLFLFFCKRAFFLICAK